jgi:K(+)-stimulated pyrophosphate-energized sodium pump
LGEGERLGAVKFCFASGKADVAAGSTQAMNEIIKGVVGSRKAIISNYHDASGDPIQNAKLVKRRTMAVRYLLKAAGLDRGSVELGKPEQTTTDGPAELARYLEVILM